MKEVASVGREDVARGGCSNARHSQKDPGPRARNAVARRPLSRGVDFGGFGVLEHGRTEQGDRFAEEGIQVGRGAHTAAVR